MKIMSSLHSFMNYSSSLNKVIAENIANANSPGYLTKTLNNSANYNSFAMYTTQAMHLSGNKHEKRFKTIHDKEATNFKPNGNNVDLVEESNKSLKTHRDFTIAAKAYKELQRMIGLAVGGGK